MASRMPSQGLRMGLRVAGSAIACLLSVFPRRLTCFILKDMPQQSFHHYFEASSSFTLLPTPAQTKTPQKVSLHPIRSHDWSCIQAFHPAPASPPHSNLQPSGRLLDSTSVIETLIPRWATPEWRGCQPAETTGSLVDGI
jgi:hypothetical protein